MYLKRMHMRIIIQMLHRYPHIRLLIQPRLKAHSLHHDIIIDNCTLMLYKQMRPRPQDDTSATSVEDVVGGQERAVGVDTLHSEEALVAVVEDGVAALNAHGCKGCDLQIIC